MLVLRWEWHYGGPKMSRMNQGVSRMSLTARLMEVVRVLRRVVSLGGNNASVEGPTVRVVCIGSYPDVFFARRYNRWRRNPERFERALAKISLAALKAATIDEFTLAKNRQIPIEAVRNLLRNSVGPTAEKSLQSMSLEVNMCEDDSPHDVNC